MSLNLSDPAILHARDQILSEDDPTSWLLLHYAPTTTNILELLSKGQDPVIPQWHETISASEGEVVFGYGEVGRKGAVLSYLPDTVGGVRRGNSFLEMLKIPTLSSRSIDYTALLSISQPSQLTEELVADKLGLHNTDMHSFTAMNPQPTATPHPAHTDIPSQPVNASQLIPNETTHASPANETASPPAQETTPSPQDTIENLNQPSSPLDNGQVQSADPSVRFAPPNQDGDDSVVNGTSASDIERRASDFPTPPESAPLSSSVSRDSDLHPGPKTREIIDLTSPTPLRHPPNTIHDLGSNPPSPPALAPPLKISPAGPPHKGDRRSRKASLTARLGLENAFSRSKDQHSPRSVSSPATPGSPKFSHTEGNGKAHIAEPSSPGSSRLRPSALVKAFHRRRSSASGSSSLPNSPQADGFSPPPLPPKDYPTPPSSNRNQFASSNKEGNLLHPGGGLRPIPSAESVDTSYPSSAPETHMSPTPSAQQALHAAVEKRMHEEQEVQERFRKDLEAMQKEGERTRLHSMGSNRDAMVIMGKEDDEDSVRLAYDESDPEEEVGQVNQDRNMSGQVEDSNATHGPTNHVSDGVGESVTSDILAQDHAHDNTADHEEENLRAHQEEWMRAEEEQRMKAEAEARVKVEEERRFREDQERLRAEERLRRAEEERLAKLREDEEMDRRRKVEDERLRVEKEAEAERMRVEMQAERERSKKEEQEAEKRRVEEVAEAEKRRKEELLQQLERAKVEGGVMLSGWLTVQSPSSSIWRRRWFRLLARELVLFKSQSVCQSLLPLPSIMRIACQVHYAHDHLRPLDMIPARGDEIDREVKTDEKDEKPILIISLIGAKISQIYEESQIQDSFKLSCDGKDYFLFTDSREDKDLVLQALAIALS
ncbi:hypothetical protein TREMEDRAFT_63836 [Tremella mesenterica DSM 1558]|uniref:uncharacterized protein n=1 Tax=Tremella mesenterica (strain ATCC 24925 / CBS 8224 / DSM 1558 / NBRC 9311 / NRRL Y-6157 / RJB 2259-6 / UBC 559-6) TaxID=578456 RepID=UPI0003F49F23|nr:uncharacterized protein TREMEDRAFT_63836 [Tremella mesenterica DSM 1558]EIW67951.1 hypothetical protein TREMEDRAFT_63836 [Tremella mesenterica DSM 1558]